MPRALIVAALTVAAALAVPAGAAAQSTLPPRVETEPNDTLASPDPVPVRSDAAIRGSITAGDSDVFRLELTQPAAVRLETFAPDRPSCEPSADPAFEDPDTLLALFDATGAALASNDDGGVEACSVLTADLAAGTYFARVTTFGGAPLPAYTLEVDFTPDPVPSRDGDGIDDGADNCPDVDNPQQEDLDSDGQGDACDGDDDGDGVADATDNCAGVANPAQADNDADGRGDDCDADDDDDGIADAQDNCALHANPDQRDTDEDGAGDACDGAFDSTPGKATGGGFVATAGGPVHFSVSAKSDAGRLTGTCVMISGRMRLRCVTVDGYLEAAGRVVLVGTAQVDGAPTRYRMELEDRGEPGRADTFALETDSGFSAAGTLAGGNLQVHHG